MSTSPFRESLMQELGITDYEIDDILGRGAFGIVYKLKSTSIPGLYVAAKLISSRGNVESVLAEAELTQRMSDNGIVKIYSVRKITPVVQVDTLKVDLAIMMEYVDGLNLQEMIDDGTAGEDLALRIVMPLLRAVGEIHKKCVVHQDIKPENVMLTTGGRVVVLDLGLACLVCTGFRRECSACDPASSYTCQNRGLIGTRSFWSPGKVRTFMTDGRMSHFDQELDDVWAACLLLLNVCLGEYPIECVGDDACLQAIAGLYEVDALARVHNPVLRTLLEWGLTVDEQDRPPVGKILEAFVSLGLP